MKHRLFVIPAILLLIPLLTSCSLWDDDDDPEPPPGADATPTTVELTGESVLAAASDRWSETQSIHFVLEANGDTYLDSDQNILLESAEGDLARPDAVTATAKVSVAIAVVDVDLIVIGQDAYMTNFISGNWEHAPEDFSYNPALLFSETDGLGPIMEDIQNPALDGSESIDGREAHRVKGVVIQDQIDEITAGSIQGDDIDVTLWIADDNFEVVRLVLSAPGADSTGETTWDLTFSDHNKEVTIEAPI